jgi:hypothetical protein
MKYRNRQLCFLSSFSKIGPAAARFSFVLALIIHAMYFSCELPVLYSALSLLNTPEIVLILQGLEGVPARTLPSPPVTISLLTDLAAYHLMPQSAFPPHG